MTVEHINTTLGLTLNIEEIAKCVDKMGLSIRTSEDKHYVQVPPTRSDIMHERDIAEDIGIAFGYNNIPKVFPPTNTVGK